MEPHWARDRYDLRFIMHTEALNTEIQIAALRRGRRLEYFTIGWNLLEALVSIVAGMIAGSVALIGFGVDSLIETASGAALIWRLPDGQIGCDTQ